MQSEVQKQTTKSIPKKPVIITLIIIILLSLAVTAQLSYMILNDDRVYNGVYIGSLYVGGLTRQQVTDLLEKEYQDKIRDIELTLKTENQNEKLKFTDADVKVDIEDTVNKSFSVGRTGNIFERFSDILNARKVNPMIDLNLTYDREKVEAAVQSLYNKTLIPVKEADLLIQDDKVVVHSGHHGENIDKDALLKEVENHIKQLEGGVIDVKVVITQPTRIDVDDYYNKITREVQDAAAKVENNKIIIIHEVAGRSVKKSDLVNIADELEKRENTEKLIPIELITPKITEDDINQKLFKNTFYTSHSSFKTDTQTNKNRAENVRLAASKLNGKILAPGEVFSFNEAVGRRTVEAGYKDAMIFRDGKVIPDLGGGICQVSSTLYNAVLFADLEVVERRNHMFVVSYVPYGLDATVYYGQTDFRFKNSTNWPIKIESWITKDNKLYFSLKGTNENPGKSVTIKSEIVKTIPFTVKYTDDPTLPEGQTKVTQKGHDGYIVDTYKTMKVNGKTVETKKITTSTYQYLTEQVLRGTKKATQKPSATVPESTTVTAPADNGKPTQESTQTPVAEKPDASVQ